MREVADGTEARSQVFKPALFTEHSNTDKMKKRRTVADSVANVGESGDRDRFLGTSVVSSSGERTDARTSIYIVTARPLSPQEGARSRSPQIY